MEHYKQEFVEFMVTSNVLTFGDFTTKSGRKTPFFINTGNYCTGEQLARLGGFYAEALHSRLGRDFDVLFGPAYKGIPLAVTAAVALATRFGHNVGYCFNRKEAKDHGEGGTLVGQRLSEGQQVVIIEDVVTAGTSVRETVPLLRSAAPVALKGLVVSVDRMERGKTDVSALEEIRSEFSLDAFAIVTLDEIVEHLFNRSIGGTVVLDSTMRGRIDEYRRMYGVPGR